MHQPPGEGNFKGNLETGIKLTILENLNMPMAYIKKRD
jgi:hypothetical protein